jgi:hypothetical protein
MRKRLRHLPPSLAASAVLLLVAAPIGWFVRGPVAAAGVAAGVVLVVVSYLVSSLVVAWVDMWARDLMLPVVLLTYALKFTALGLVMYKVADAGWAGLAPMGIAIIAATLVWTGAQLAWLLRARIPYVELD